MAKVGRPPKEKKANQHLCISPETRRKINLIRAGLGLSQDQVVELLVKEYEKAHQ